MQSFESMIREAIASHRAEIERLERALAASPGAERGTVRLVEARVKITPEAHTRLRPSKYEPLFRAYARAGRPLSNDDMIRIAAEWGHQIDRSNMRSIVHNQKVLGRAKPVADGYLWNLETTSSPGGEAPTGGVTPPASFTDSTGQEREGSTQDAPGVGGT